MDSTEGLKAAVNATLDEIAALRGQLATMEQTVERQNNDLAARNATIAGMQNSMSNVTAERNELVKQLEAMHQKLLMTEATLEKALQAESQLHQIISPDKP